MRQDDSVKMQELDNYNEQVEILAMRMHSKIKSGGLIAVGAIHLSFSDFFSDCEIDTDIILQVMQDKCYADKLQEHLECELYKWCEKQSKLVIG